MKNIWCVDVENKDDPYGEGPGYQFLVFAPSKDAAKKRVEKHIAHRKDLHGWGAVFKIVHMPRAVLS